MKIDDIENSPARKFIRDMFSKYPRNPIDPREFYITYENGAIVVFELTPSVQSKNLVHISFVRAHPQGTGAGRQGMIDLMNHAREAGLGLDLSIWEKNKSRLLRFYRSLGFRGNADLMTWTPDNLSEAEFDPKGWGSTPKGIDIDYFGLQVKMRPSVFLRLAYPLTKGTTNPAVATYMQRGGKISYPSLDIREPDEWQEGDYSKFAKVVDHEGRNRMTNWLKMHGDEPVTVHIFLSNASRRRYITDEMIKRLSDGLINQQGTTLIPRPFEAETALEESKEIVSEIERWGARDYTGLEKDHYEGYDFRKDLSGVRELSGYPGYYWRVNRDNYIVIAKERTKIKSPELKAVAILSLSKQYYADEYVWSTVEISVRQRFRGKGLGSMLYRLAMMPKPQGLGYTIRSGWSQTPGGRAMWEGLRNDPAVEVVGFLTIANDNNLLDNEMFLDDLFGKTGAVYVGKKKLGSRIQHYFEFPVDKNNNNPALGSLIQVYDPKNTMSSTDIGLLARYRG